MELFLPFENIYPRKLPIYQNSNLGDKELVQALILDAEITKVFTEETSRLDWIMQNKNLKKLIYFFAFSTESQSEYGNVFILSYSFTFVLFGCR